MSQTMSVEQQINAMQAQINAMVGAVTNLSKVVQGMAEPKVDLIPDEKPTVTEVKSAPMNYDQYVEILKDKAKRKGLEIRGKVTDDRVKGWAAATEFYFNEPKAVKVPEPTFTAAARTTVKAKGAIDWSQFGQKEQSAERFGIVPKAVAAEMYSNHPMKSLADEIVANYRSRLFAMSQAGKENAQIVQFRTMPLNGNHRKCLGILARGTTTPNLLLNLCEVLDIFKSTGFDVNSLTED